MQKAKVRKKALSRGHSTPDEVGEFARSIRARRSWSTTFRRCKRLIPQLALTSTRFPSRRYPTSEPMPSLLLPISPFPYPTPQPMQYSPDPELQPHPLTGGELHLRLILSSLASQINAVWNDRSSEDATIDSKHPSTSTIRNLAIPARDFMVIRISGHELGRRSCGDEPGAGGDAACDAEMGGARRTMGGRRS